MATLNTDCLKSAIRNISGEEKHFSFLGYHGVTLADNERHEFVGTILDAVHGIDFPERSRRITALNDSIAAGLLEIVRTPPVFLEDTSSTSGGNVKQLALASGVLTVIEPCFGGAESDSG